LPLDPGQRRALRLGLDHTDDLLVDVQQVVSPTMPRLHDRLADRAALRPEQVEIAAVHDGPAGDLQLFVDEDTSPLLCSEGSCGIHKNGQ